MPAKHAKPPIILPAESSDDEAEAKVPDPPVPPIIAPVVPPIIPIMPPAVPPPVLVPPALPPLFGAPMQVPLPPTKHSDSYHQPLVDRPCRTIVLLEVGLIWNL